jgi:hypothetical protein
MGKAAVDLPDPLQTSSGPDRGRALTSTDDLLAQLAGEEIDRLLAEVEDAAPAPAEPAPAPAPSAAPPAFLLETPSPTPASTAAVPPVIDEPAPQPDLARDAADLNAELDAIFGAAAAAPPSPAVLHPPQPGVSAAGPDADSADTSAAERAGLMAPAAAAAAGSPRSQPAAAPAAAITASAPAPARAAAAPEPDAGPLPIYLRPLEWINAPLESCPQPVRDFVGKAAIITLANAAAILIYVLLFRRG